MNPQQYILGEQARVRIRSVLEWGNTFARLMLREVPLNTGTVVAVFSSPVDQSKLNEFEYGGKLPLPAKETWIGAPNIFLMIPTPTSDSCFVSIVQDFLQANPLHMCLCEDALARSTDSGLAKRKSRIYFFNQEVYSVLLFIDHKDDVILQANRETHSLPYFISALIAQPKQLFSTEPMRGVFTQDTLTVLARNVKSLIIGAYDGEGYLVWNIND